MIESTVRCGAAAAALSVLVGCGEEPAAARSFTFAAAPRTTQELPADIARLVPPSAAGVVHVPRAGMLSAQLEEIVRLVMPGAESQLDVPALVGRLGLRPRDLDLERGAALILDVLRGPAPFLVLPVRDPSGAADLVEAKTTISGGYLGIPIGPLPLPEAGPGTPDLATALPGGDLALRIDLLKALHPFREAIQAQLDPQALVLRSGQLPDPAAMQAISIVFEQIRGLLGTARILDVGLRLRSGALDLDVVLQVAEGSSWDLGGDAPDAELVHIARSLALPDASLVLLSTPVMARWMDTFQPLFQQQAAGKDPEQARAYAAMMNETRRLYGMFEVGVAAAVRVTGGRPEAVLCTAARDPAALVDGIVQYQDAYNRAWSAAHPSAPPMPGPARQEIAGVPFTGLTMPLDPGTGGAGATPTGRWRDWAAELWGNAAARVQLGATDRHVIGVTERAPAVAVVAALRGGPREPITLLESVLKRLHATPRFLLACDLRATMQGIRAGLPEAKRFGAVPDGAPVLVWLALSATGSRYELQLHADIVPMLGLQRGPR